jgi:hypothetical protein
MRATMNERDNSELPQAHQIESDKAVKALLRQAESAADECPGCGADLSRGMHRAGCPVS